ncbi:MAG: Alanine racemase [Pseudomonadota bacterium]|jgi:alanine racemase
MSPSELSILNTFDHRPTCAEVDLGVLRENLNAIRAFVSPSKVMAVVKANGYGHGLERVALTLQHAGVDSLGVAYIEEAIALRQGGVTIPILVFGGLLQDQLELYLKHDIDVTASSVSKLEQIEATAQRLKRRARVHLKIDTGLERIGVHYYSANTLFDAALRVQHSDVVGVYSHFADVNLGDLQIAEVQLERFLASLRYYEERATGPFLRHIASSSGLMALKASHLDMVRPGLALYGIYPGSGYSSILPVKPVLSLKSQVVYFKVVKKGAGVSYGHTWFAPEDTRVVTVPIGYGDGYLRALSNKASVIIRGKKSPIVGVVCMDQLMVNVGPDGVGYNGDEVIMIGESGGERISVEELAGLIGTTPHEVVVSLNQRIPRVYRG